MKTENIFYNYFLQKEKVRRQEALDLFEACDYSTLCRNYIHYLKTENKEVELTDLSIDSVIAQLTCIKDELPKNVTHVSVDASREESEAMFGLDEQIIYVGWIEYNIEPATICSSLARCWASSAEWKMKHQPNGKDGKAAQAIYDALIKNYAE